MVTLVKHRWQDHSYVISVPMRKVGPLIINTSAGQEQVMLPMATLETPLWPATQRGALACNHAGGITVALLREQMTRSVALKASSVTYLAQVMQALPERWPELQAVVQASSRYAQLLAIHPQIIGSVLYLRFACTTGDASGHNMVTLAADRLISWLLANYPELEYLAISGNFCTDKKVSAVNSILGRGKYVVAEALIPANVCQRILRTTPAQIVAININKNLIGSIIAGSLHSANAHVANIISALYLATGQDIANVVEGSQGIVSAELRGDALYFAVSLPNIIVGTVGNGKDLLYVQENLALLDCLAPRPPGANARRLASIIAAAVLCGELSLLATQTKQGALMHSHLQLERGVNA